MKNDSANKPRTKPASFVSVPFSFTFAVIFWIEIWLLIIISAIGYIVTNEYFNNLDASFKQRGKSLVLSLSSAGRFAYQTKKYGSLTNVFQKLVSSSDKEFYKKSISEIFLLDKSGKIFAHSDTTILPKYSENPISSIALKYNNEFYHSGLLISEGQVYIQKSKIQNSLYNKSSYFMRWVLPENLDYTIDFTTPVMYKGKKQGTMHVIMNRVFMYHFLEKMLSKFVLIIGIMLVIGILVGLLLIFAFVQRAKYLQKVWQNLFRYKWENELAQKELNNLGEKIDNMSQKTVPPREKHFSDVQDAIFVK